MDKSCPIPEPFRAKAGTVFFLAGVFPAFFGYLGQNYSFSLGLILAGAFMLLGPLFAFALRFVETDQEGC